MGGDAMKLKSILLLQVLMLVLGGCGGTQTADTPTPKATLVSEVEVEPSPTAEPPQPEPTKTPVPTETAYSDTPTPFPTPTSIAPPTSTPLPIPTNTPTQVPPTPTPVLYTNVDSFGFTLTIDGEVNVESSGLLVDDANISEGIIFFESSGANSILLWFEDSDSDINAVLSDNYTSLVQSQPDLTLSLINEGNVTVESYAGQYLAFITNSASGDSGGGIIGSWLCPTGTTFALTVTGSDAAVVQIRFKRLLDGFACVS
jgi:hypothetical protein